MRERINSFELQDGSCIRHMTDGAASVSTATYDRMDPTIGGVVAGQQGPTLREKRLGAELKRLRTQAHVSQQDAAQVIDGTQSKISKIENGRTRPRRLEVIALLDRYDVAADSKERTDLLRLWRVSTQPQYVAHHDLRADMRELVDLESSCQRMEILATMHLPGLLQIEAYAAAMIQGLEPTLEFEEVKRYVDLRMERQKILDREDPPLVVCILDEGVIRRPIGGPAVMVEQLKYLLELSRRPHVVIQVVPFEQAVYPGIHGSFRTLVSEDNALDVVEVSTWAKTLYMQEPTDVATYRKLFDEIRTTALPSRQTAQLLTAAVRDYQGKTEDSE
jgi:transcriptional regulator with XRE-family HTH domain